jgi:cell division protein ZapA
MDKPTRVRLMGREYTLRVREEDEALTQEMAAYVSAKMEAFRNAHPEQSEITAAVITALALAEEIYTLRDRQYPELDDELKALDKRLADALSNGQ